VKRLLAALTLILSLATFAKEVIPPPPKQYFNDYSHVVSPAATERLNATLENFERETSSQVVIAIFQKMESDSSIEDYTVRVAQSWKVGQKTRDNGVVLFVFIQDRQMYLQVGYGLEGALPDAICKRIIDDEIKPHFRNGDYDGGLTAGVSAILTAAKGEYKGSGGTVAERVQRLTGIAPFVISVVIIVLIFIVFLRGGGYNRRNSGWTISSGGSSRGWGGSGFSRGGGGFSGGGGGFSGGGGSFGGGGAGGRW
jgi:uncharacterized protein